jgi:hypothetical protein
MSDDRQNLSAVAFGTDFGQVKNGEILKFVDGRWSPRGGPEFPRGTRMLLRGMRRALQHWECQTVVDEIIERPGERLPSVKELNAEIPESEWEPGLDGKPRKPWTLYYVFYLLNDDDGCPYYHSNCTYGQMLAYNELANKLTIDAAKGLRGIPILELQSKVMPTTKGPKQRPFYKVHNYFGNSAQVAPQRIESDLTPPTSRAIEHNTGKVEPHTVKPTKRIVETPRGGEDNDSEPDVAAYAHYDD